MSPLFHRPVAWIWVLGLFAARIAAQEEDPTPPDRPVDQPAAGESQDPVPEGGLAGQVSVEHADEGKKVGEILIEPDVDYASSITRLLRTKVGQPLRHADVAEDMRNLWRLRQILVTQVSVEDVEGGDVRVIFQIVEQPAYDRIEFRGLEEFKEEDVRALLGIIRGQRINRVGAEKYALTLLDRYRRDGFAFVDVRIEEDAERGALTMYVDEGPEVTIREVRFRGNRAFPGKTWLGLTRNLIGSSEMKSTEGIFGGAPYSSEVVEEDLDRLRFFYRRHGYRDARVELADVVPTRHRDEVDLTIRIDEGNRYRISKVGVRRVDSQGLPVVSEPIYPTEQLLEVLKVKAGEFFDQGRVDLDKLALEEFYGKRGHPKASFGIVDAFRQPQPIEVFDTERAEIELIYQIYEGTPKTLRDVLIRGNTETKDSVVRRKVFLFPGETLDTTKIRRSIRVLNALRYFSDPSNPAPVRFELQPVEDDQQALDLAIDVQEGSTGEFLWGAGVSTAVGLQARFQFNKRNFDLTRLPSTWEPLQAISEIADGHAFHGAGQDLQLSLSPGTEISHFQISFSDPDIFARHFDTIGLRVNGFRRLQRLDSYDRDSLGAQISLSRQFSEEFSVSFGIRQETLEVQGIDANAPTIVFDAEGSTELRGVNATVQLQDFDDFLQPTDGYRFRVRGELVGGIFGADEDFVVGRIDYQKFTPLHRDARGRAHVLRYSGSFDIGEAFGGSDDLFLTERFTMGGTTLRGFDQRQAGPSQFGEPVGGEARLLSTLEYQFPLVSTRQQRSLREAEILRGVMFVDFGMLGLEFGDREFQRPRLSVGFGVRILVPQLQVPIALDLAWPILDQETDERRQFFFSLSHF